MAIDPKQQTGLQDSETSESGSDIPSGAAGDGNQCANAIGCVYTTQKEKNVQLAYMDTKRFPFDKPDILEGGGGGGARGGAGGASLGVGDLFKAGALLFAGKAATKKPKVGKTETPDDKSNKKDEVKVVDDPCKTGRYGDRKRDGKDECPDGHDAHHVPSDYTLRYGTRGDGSSRMPDLGGIDDGWSICLEKADHAAAHRIADPAVAQLGGANGYAPLGDVIDKSVDAVDQVMKKKNDPNWEKCKEKLKKELKDKYKDKLNWPVRTTKTPPGFPTSD